jgi:hypothetical protein
MVTTVANVWKMGRIEPRRKLASTARAPPPSDPNSGERSCLLYGMSFQAKLISVLMHR